MGAGFNFARALGAKKEGPARRPSRPPPAQPGATAAADAARQRAAAANKHNGLFVPRDAAAARAAAGPKKVTFELVPDMPPVAAELEPGMTMAEAEERATVQACLQLMQPRKRALKELYPAWANPTCWGSPAELQRQTGCSLEVC